jgi:hypothetical protein
MKISLSDNVTAWDYLNQFRQDAVLLAACLSLCYNVSCSLPLETEFTSLRIEGRFVCAYEFHSSKGF